MFAGAGVWSRDKGLVRVAERQRRPGDADRAAVLCAQPRAGYGSIHEK